MKKSVWIILVVLAVVLIGIFVIFKEANTNIDSIKKSPDYVKVLDKIEKGNDYVIKTDRNDNCFPYRYYNRGCYYRSNEEDETFFDGQILGYNLTKDEIIELCYKFSHKGAVAYCLKNSSEKEKCLAFAEDNDYLIRICNLANNEIIPDENFYLGSKNDSLSFVKYSELLNN